MKHKPFYLMDIWYGEQCIDLFGNYLEVGDVDGDGIDEIIVSSPTASFINRKNSVNPEERISSGKVTVMKGKNKRVLFEWGGQDNYVHFGYAVALGDINGDGTPEIIISSPYEGYEELIECGAVRVFSGVTGKLLKTIFGSQSYQRLGYTLATGDINKDGFDDLIISSSLFDEEGKKDTGKVEIYSGKDASLLHSFSIPEKEQFGYSLAVADINNDGHQDIIIGAPEASTDEKIRCGKVYVYSGINRELMFHIEGTKSRNCIGTSLGVADVNGDRQVEIVIGSGLASSNGYIQNGQILAFSGQGKFLFGVHGDYHHLSLGKKIVLYDLDGDGIKEIIGGTSGSYVIILNGTTGKAIKKIYGEENVFFSASLAAGDINGDKKTELLISSLATRHEGELKGAIYLFSTDPQYPKRGSFINPNKKG
ncbi:FG-GAP-like repeat-containing protein [Bacillus solitudinis]|uniref:FG-GAP-like repeat-containing protein n=1 Tax=Bacillus solitudinis TaxID=2014074 RepID=UPI000C23685B|nr:FG-GAP-like repeat-containing protein [Bacillus solitudinis]